MSPTSAPEYLYLTTIGWRTGKPHEIEIWFTEFEGRFYLVSELGHRAHWVQNVERQSEVSFQVGRRTYQGKGRVVDPQHDPELHARAWQLSIQKYGWGEGLGVELREE